MDIKKIIREEIDNQFDWAEDIRPIPELPKDMIHVGAIYRVNPKRAGFDDLDMILKVYDVADDTVHYEIIVSNINDETVGDKSYVGYREALELLSNKHEKGPYWLYQQYESINESEFDWVDDVSTYDHYEHMEMVVYEDDSSTGMVTMETYEDPKHQWMFDGTKKIIFTYDLRVPPDASVPYTAIETMCQILYYSWVRGERTPQQLEGEYFWNGKVFTKSIDKLK